MLSTISDLIHGHHRRTQWLTLAFILVAGVIGGPLAGSLHSSSSNAPTSADSQQADRLIQQATGRQPSAGVVLLVRTPHGTSADAPRIHTLARQLDHIPGIATVQGPAAVARDHRDTIISGTLSSSASDQTVATAVQSAFGHDGDVVVGGNTIVSAQIGSTVSKDLGFSEIIVLPLLIGLALLFFRGRAALIPLAVGGTTVLGTFLALTGVNQVYGLSVYALNLVIGLGLGLSVDYTLFILSRYRDELAGGASVADAIRTSMTQAGRTVIFSALTVAFALATLTVFPLNFAISMGVAGAVTALVAAASALVITPALLTAWGTKLARPADARSTRRWTRFAAAVTRRPGAIAILTAAAMIAIASTSLGTRWTPVDRQVIPTDQSSRTVADALASQFPQADSTPVVVVASGPERDRDEVVSLAARVRRVPGVAEVDAPRYLGRDTWRFDAQPAGDPTGASAQRVVSTVRSLPATLPVHVGGGAAEFVDQQAAIAGRLPLAIGLLVALTFLVLWLMTDSLILPLKALVMNALTVGAALAPLNFIYGHGRLTGLLGYTSNGGVEPVNFLVAAALVLALSTDYGVFLLGRITEAHRAGSRVRDAVVLGVGRTGRVLTAAAILLAVAIGAFATSQISFIQEIGIATAFGVLLDALVVRSLLVPAMMTLLGEANWWSPQLLHRLHARITGGATSPTATPATANSAEAMGVPG